MQKLATLIFGIVLLACSTVHANEKIDFSKLPMAAGKAALTENGFYINRIIGTANFSPELRLPVQLFYNSASQKTGILGFAWRIPQLESSAVPEKDGVTWQTPWGEKIRFFEKQKPKKETLEIFKNAMQGKGFFAPFADWNADGKTGSGNWTFTGKNKFEGWKFVYRDAKLRTIAAPSGRSVEFEYSSGNPVAVRQDGTAFIQIAYNGRRVSAITINGIRTELKYDSREIRFLPETPAAATVTRTRTVLASCSVPGIAPVEFGYDDAGYLNSVKQGLFEEKITVQHETEQQRLSYLKQLAEAKRNKKNENTVHRSRVSGRILSDMNFKYSYPSGLPGKVKLTDKMNRSASYDFDSKVGIFKLSDFSGKRNTIYYFMRYDVAYNGKVRQIVDGRGRVVVSYRYDKLSGNVTRIRDMAKNDINFKYDDQGNLRLVEKRGADERTAGSVMSFSYASRGNPSAINLLNENGETVRSTRIAYDQNRQPIMIDNGQRKNMIYYNRSGYPVRLIDGFNQISKIEYDKFNRMISNENPFGVKTLLTYNEAGLVTKVERRDGDDVLSFLEVSYDSAGRPVSYRDQQNRVKKFDRDAFGHVVKEYFPDETAVEYKYNALGQLAQVLDQNRHKIQFNWNRFGLDSRTTAANQLTDYVYDKYGMLTKVDSKWKGRTDRSIKYEYDDLDRIVRITYGKNEVETFRYNTWGKLIAGTKGGKSATYKYDYFGRLIEKTEGALINRYEYNAYGQRTYRLTQNGTFRQEERKTYDRFGRLIKIESGNSTVLYSYNDRNQPKTQRINNMLIRYEYTKYGQLKAKILGGETSPVSKLEYIYTKDGQISGRLANGKYQQYSYDKKGQLLSVFDTDAGKIVEQYIYDPAGNILSKTVNGKTTAYTYDKANQLVTSTTDGKVTNYQYDAAGRLVKEGNKTYSYGYLDKILSVKENETDIAKFTYHMDGQIATASTKAGTESFLWDGLALISRNSVQYINEPYVTGGNPILANDKVLFNDMLGTTLGIQSDKYEPIQRDAFGMVTQDVSENFFTGKPYIGELGYAFLFRNYRAEQGKWQSSDPYRLASTLPYYSFHNHTVNEYLSYPDGWNNLAYCNNGVTSLMDPLGLVKCPICGRENPTVSFFNKDSFYAMGRDGIPVFNPQNPIMNFIEDYLPNMHYFAVVHDAIVEELAPKGGLADYIVNIPTMPLAYVYAFAENSLSAFNDFINWTAGILGFGPTKLSPCCPTRFYFE